MLFTSLSFIVFIVIVLLVYPNLKLRSQNIFLLIASYIFYGYWDWRFTFLLFVLTCINFRIGQRIHDSETPRTRKILLILSVATSLGILGFFKYFNFFIESVSLFLAAVGFKANLPVLKIILPVGISFFTFQTLSYAFDIYRKTLKPTKSFIDFSLFVAFFPQLVAGPIERASNLLPQIIEKRQINKWKILTGLNLVLIGYFKKVAIADTLAPIVQNIFAAPETMTSGQLWTGVYAFSLQIYGDFAGYTDIARGVARLLGFELMENFNAPYLSRSITEFWRRWHISLSSWLRDYLYISLGGNRLGKTRTYVNLIVTMFLGGLWHGAAWNFVFWGLFHGIYLSVHRMIKKNGSLETIFKFNAFVSIKNVVKCVFTFHVVAITWIFFRSPDLKTTITYFEGLFLLQNFDGISSQVLFAGVLVLILDFAQILTKSHTWLTDRHDITILRYTVAQFLIFGVLASTVAHTQTITPFIYFQF